MGHGETSLYHNCNIQHVCFFFFFLFVCLFVFLTTRIHGSRRFYVYNLLIGHSIVMWRLELKHKVLNFMGVKGRACVPRI